MSYPYDQQNPGQGHQGYAQYPAQGGYQAPPAPQYQQYDQPSQYAQQPQHSGYPPQQQGYYSSASPGPTYEQQQPGLGQSFGYAPQSGYQEGAPHLQGSSYEQHYGQRDNNSYPSQTPHGQYPQQPTYNDGAYAQQSSYGPSDPSQQQAGDRGLMGAVAGGFAGRKMGGGLLASAAGALLGSKLEDKFKNKHKQNQNPYSH